MCSTRAGDSLTSLRQVIDALASNPVGDLTDDELLDVMRRMRSEMSRLDAQFTRLVATVNARNSAATEGYLSTVAFLVHGLHMGRGESRQVLTTGRKLAELPQTAAAFSAGHISARHAAVIAVGADKVGPVVAAREDGFLAGVARTLDPGALNTVVQTLRSVVDPDGVDRDAVRRYEQRGLTASPTFDGMVTVDGLLDPDTGAGLIAALNSGPPPPPGDRRSAAQRRADRLGELLRHQAATTTGMTLAAGKTAATALGPSLQLTLTAGLDTLRGTPGAAPAILDWIGPIAPSTARLLACDATVTGVVTDEDGNPLDVGWRHRTATPAQRKALAVRDRHCQAPGCDRPWQWCDAHHYIPWYDGGRTDVGDLLWLCRRHHRAVHLGTWRIEKLAPGRFRFHHHRTDPSPRAQPRPVART